MSGAGAGHDILPPIPLDTVFGSLTVIERVLIEDRRSTQGRTMYRCRCSCGARENVEARDLRRGRVHACRRCRSQAAIEREEAAEWMG